MAIKTRLGAERYNNRMSKIHADAKRLEHERLERGEMPNPGLTDPETARKYGWKITGREVTAIDAPQLTPRELDTIIAALRMWQADVTDDMTKDEGIPVDFADIALAHGHALSSDAIDALIERLN